MDSTILFSLIAPVTDEGHLLTLTLDSLLSQTERRFEVIVIDKLGQGKIEALLKSYPDLSIQICPIISGVESEAFNEALKRAKGKYIQFLTAGDRYLSQEGLSYLAELVRGEPQLVYSGFLIHGSETALFPLDKKTLQKGVFSQDSCFLRQAILDLGGFDASFSYRFAFELLCRLFLHQEMRSVCSRRVLTDGEPKTLHPRAVWGYAVETYRILYRHFGLWTAIRWVFVQDHLQMFSWLKHRFKQAFWQER